MWPFSIFAKPKPSIPDAPVPYTLVEAEVFKYSDVIGVAEKLLDKASLLKDYDLGLLTPRAVAREVIETSSYCLPTLVKNLTIYNQLIDAEQHAQLIGLGKHYRSTVMPVNFEFYLADEEALDIDIGASLLALHEQLAKHVSLVRHSVQGNFYYQRLSNHLYREIFALLQLLHSLKETAMS